MVVVAVAAVDRHHHRYQDHLAVDADVDPFLDLRVSTGLLRRKAPEQPEPNHHHFGLYLGS